MSSDIEGLVGSRKLHDGIIAVIEQRGAAEEESGSQTSPEPYIKPESTGVLADIAPYLARVERVAWVLEQTTNHAREMELAVNDLHQRQAELDADLDEAARRISELEQALLAERNRATRAQAIAAQAAQRVQTVESALADANARADGLASAIEKAFADVIDDSGAQTEEGGSMRRGPESTNALPCRRKI